MFVAPLCHNLYDFLLYQLQVVLYVEFNVGGKTVDGQFRVGESDIVEVPRVVPIAKVGKVKLFFSCSGNSWCSEFSKVSVDQRK